ncbi:MAG: hypothetical protein KGV58_00800 [Campylobacteraceae bacterium]|nr:hypothetical protein [Campylobacteraceae bacterium]MBS9778828.1 hypothetical protein [Campylobacteraceae bacterium]
MKLKFIATCILTFSVIGCASTNNYYVKDNQNISTQNIGTKYVPVQRYVRVYDDVYEDVPYENCYDKKVKVYDENVGSDPAAMIVGGVLGTLIGNRLGRKSHSTFSRRASRVGGALIGSVIGNSLATNHRTQNTASYTTKRICQQNYTKQKRRVLAGYDNIGYYNGVEIVKFSPRKLSQIPVNVSISY